MFPANPPIARWNAMASARLVRGTGGVRSTPIRPMTTASVIAAPAARFSTDSRSVLDDGVPERRPDLRRLVRAIAHPQPEWREVRVTDADPDADRAVEERVGL